MMEKILPSSRARMEVARTIYENPGINLSGLIKIVRASPNTVLDYVNLLEKYGVVKGKRIGGKKKTHIRMFAPDTSTEYGILVFTSVEMNKKISLMEKYGELKPFIGQLGDLLSGGEVEFCLVYGSFARFAAGHDSDLDILIVGKADKEMQKRISEIFVTAKRNFSIKIETKKSFLEKAKNGDALHKSMLERHVVLWNEKNFVEFLNLAAQPSL